MVRCQFPCQSSAVAWCEYFSANVYIMVQCHKVSENYFLFRNSLVSSLWILNWGQKEKKMV